MRLKEWHVLAGVFVASMTVILGTSFYSSASNPAPIMSDGALIERSKELPEVKAFLTKYPNATAHVERSSDILVVHTLRTMQSEIQDEQSGTQDGPMVMLVVFLSRSDTDVKHVDFLCFDGESRREVGDAAIVGFLERGEDRHCFD